MTDKKPNDLATIEDLNGGIAVVKKEIEDILAAGVMLSDGDPSNNGPAVLEIVQSVSVIGGMLALAVASTVHALQSLGVM